MSLGKVSPLSEENGRNECPEVEEGADPAGTNLDPQRTGALTKGLIRFSGAEGEMKVRLASPIKCFNLYSTCTNW